MAQYVYFNCGTKREVKSMSPRTGRPKVDKPKTIEVKARIDEETNERLIKYCEKNQLSRTDVVRMGIEMVITKKE